VVSSKPSDPKPEPPVSFKGLVSPSGVEKPADRRSRAPFLGNPAGAVKKFTRFPAQFVKTSLYHRG
jgi:hypothetical protein